MSNSPRSLSIACSFFLAVASMACGDSKTTKKKGPDASSSGEDNAGGSTAKGGSGAGGAGRGGAGMGGAGMGGMGMGGAGMGGAGRGGAGMGGAGMGGAGMGGAGMGGARMPDGGPARDGSTDSVSSADAGPAKVLETVVPLKAMWKYLDDGTDQKVAWQAAAFVDTAWKTGAAKLGYGENDEGTVVGFGPDAMMKFTTTYFRQTFDVKDAAKIKSVLLQLVADDGAIVYLNGEEVWRYNMPAGDVTFQTFATASIGGANESKVNENDMLSVMKLKEGKNTIAVEIHQSDLASSDLSFDFGLKVERTASAGDGGTADAPADGASTTTDATATDAAPTEAGAATDAPVDAVAAVDAIPASDAPSDAVTD